MKQADISITVLCYFLYFQETIMPKLVWIRESLRQETEHSYLIPFLCAGDKLLIRNVCVGDNSDELRQAISQYNNANVDLPKYWQTPATVITTLNELFHNNKLDISAYERAELRKSLMQSNENIKIAIASENSDAIETLLKAYPASHIGDALHAATRKGHAESIACLFEYGANGFLKDESGRKAFEYICKNESQVRDVFLKYDPAYKQFLKETATDAQLKTTVVATPLQQLSTFNNGQVQNNNPSAAVESSSTLN